MNTIRIITPPNWTNDQRGKFFEDLVGRLLERQRFSIIERVRFTGMEIDLIADNLDTGQRAFVECKFIQQPFSSNVLDLLLGKAIRRDAELMYLFSTAPPGSEAKGVIDELKRAPPQNMPKFAFIGPTELEQIFKDVFNTEIDPTLSNIDDVSSSSLIIAPGMDPFWILEQQLDGIPYRAIACPCRNSDLPPKESIRKILEENDLFISLDLEYAISDKSHQKAKLSTPEINEIVTPIPQADSLDDYRPCRPDQFVGRYDLQKQIWTFLDLIRNDKTTSRILSLSGPSGYGKSSIILKLADRFRNKKWANRYYLFPVDSRSARGPIFISRAIKAGFDAALEDGFIIAPGMKIDIESTEAIIQSKSIKKALELLKKKNRILIIFFDQFEELLSKSELLSAFNSLRELAFEVNAVQSNVVIGFSWRTGITVSDDNPAYHLWHALKDIRHGIKIGEFTSAEASQLVGLFEKDLSQKLLPPLRRRLLEQGQGLPWLLKKLCIHIHREINRGTSQEQLLGSRLNIKSIFDEDLEPLSDGEIECLRYIASNSPADILDVHERFSQPLINNLYGQRLIVRTGQKYSVYWDIFRDYLVDNIVPAIPITYVPQVELSMAIRAFLLLDELKSADIETLADRLGYKPKTVQNIITDLSNLILINRDEHGIYKVREELRDSDVQELARFLQYQLNDHIVISSIYKEIEPGQSILFGRFFEIIRDSYSSATRNQRTIGIYANRLLPWFKFIGLIEVTGETVIRPLDTGDEFGKIQISDGRKPRGHRALMCESSPDHDLSLALQLAKEKSILRNQLMMQSHRNAASDLVALDLAYWDGDYLTSSQDLIQLADKDDATVMAEILSRAQSSEFLSKLSKIIASKPGSSNADFGKHLSLSLNRDWSKSSCIRYSSAGRRWLRSITST
jgi:hypothetical protein